MTSFEVTEKTSVTYTAVFKDGAGATIPLTDMASLTITLYSLDSPTKAIINSRNAQSVLNANGGTFASTGGNFTMELGPSDTAVLDSTLKRERHIMQFDFTYNGGAKTGRHQVKLIVKNLDKVT